MRTPVARVRQGAAPLKAAPSPPLGGSQSLISRMFPSLLLELMEAGQDMALNWTMTLCHNYKVTAVNIIIIIFFDSCQY